MWVINLARKNRVLVIAAHPDDEVLGVGGTILKHHAQGDQVFVCIVTSGHEPRWSLEYVKQQANESVEVDKILHIISRVCLAFPSTELNTVPHNTLNDKISEAITQFKPNIIYTHFANDINKDHRLIYESVMVSTRPTTHRIRVLCFETPSSSEWNNHAFTPNFYVDISPYINQKIDAFAQYKSEVKPHPHPRSLEGVRILANKRGIEVCTDYAEAFILIKDFWM